MDPSNVKYCARMLVSICQHWWFKLLFTIPLTIYEYLFDPQHNRLLVSLFVLVLFDFLTGIFAVLAEKGTISSYKILRTALKVVIYFMLIASARISEAAIHLYILDETVIGFTTGTELVSIIENVARMGYAVPKKLLSKLKNLMQQQ